MTHKSGSATGDTYTLREQAILAHYTRRGMLRYKDVEAYYCNACGIVYNVKCPKCRLESARLHGQYNSTDSLFKRTTDTFERWDGYVWTQVECPKCDFLFKVIVR